MHGQRNERQVHPHSSNAEATRRQRGDLVASPYQSVPYGMSVEDVRYKGQGGRSVR